MKLALVVLMVPAVAMANPLANLFGNNMGNFDVASILGNADTSQLASSLFGNGASANPLSSILGQLGGGQSDASGDCVSGTFGSAMGAAGDSPFGGITQMIGGGNIDFCKSREQPESAKSVGWNDLQEFLKNPNAAIDKAAKEACMKQVEDEKARCERQKKVLCAVLDPTSSPDALFGAFRENICIDQKQKQAADACQQVSGMILGGRGVSQGEITTVVKDTATKGATTNLLCETDPADLDTDSLLDPNKAQSAIQAAQAAKTANQLLGGSGGNGASALGNLGSLGNSGGNAASALGNLGGSGGNAASALGNLGNSGGASALGNLGNSGGASALGNLGNSGAASALGNLGNSGGASALGNLGGGGLPSLGALGRFRRHAK